MSKKHLIFGMIILFLVVVLNYSTFLTLFISLKTVVKKQFPSDSELTFTRICSDLNGKELTSLNIQKLDGWSFVSGGLARPAEENLRRLENNTDPFFNVYHRKQYDSTWVCVVEKGQGGKIKTSTRYIYD
jgi:hypothetical protein